jgi:hypothetical protein
MQGERYETHSNSVNGHGSGLFGRIRLPGAECTGKQTVANHSSCRLSGLLIAGQMSISVALEHFNILVAELHPISLLRVLGILLVVGGVLMVRMF